MIQSICVYCGSSAGSDPRYAQAARTVGTELALQGIRLVYGGGQLGLMGVVADAVLAAGGSVVGVIPEPLARKEVAHENLTELHIVPDMHTRKARMADLSDAFLTLPGGVGTLEEFFEIFTWAVLGLHNKPIGLLNVLNYYEPLLTLFDTMVIRRFLPEKYRELLITGADPKDLLQRMINAKPPVIGPKYLDISQI